MSAYVSVEVEFSDQSSLIDALKGLGLTDEQIEVHETPANLYGYHGDMRAETANVIVRRKHIGHASNDFGFVKQGDKYKLHLSEYDQKATPSRFGCQDTKEFVTKLKVGYTESWTLKQAAKHSYSSVVTKSKDKTVIRLTRW